LASSLWFAMVRGPVRLFILGVVFLGVVATAVLAYNSMLPKSRREVLPPASVPPVVDLCEQPLQHRVDGTFTPLFCSGGAINKEAWRYAAQDNPEVMRLGRDPAPSAVATAIQNDLRNLESGWGECSAAVLAAAYYGWTFHIDPVDGLPFDCPILR
jgi:hypothetical protein